MLVGGVVSVLRRLVVRREIDQAPELASDFAWLLASQYAAER
jgi:hypothetical protein